MKPNELSCSAEPPLGLEKPTSAEVLGVALDSFSPPNSLAKATNQRGEPLVQLDLATVDDAVLLDHDAALLNRLAYVTSLVRVIKFLRRTATTFSEEESQAKVSVAYIKNLEGSRLSALQIGRSGADMNLRDEVAEMRGKLAAIADYKARGIAKRQGASLRADQAARAKNNPPDGAV